MATTRDRRKTAMLALVAFAKADRTDLENEQDFYTCIADLVANLGHLAQKHGRSAGYTGLDMYKHAIGMFTAENRDPDDEPYEDDEVEITGIPGPSNRDIGRWRAKGKVRRSKRTAP